MFDRGRQPYDVSNILLSAKLRLKGCWDNAKEKRAYGLFSLDPFHDIKLLPYVTDPEGNIGDKQT